MRATNMAITTKIQFSRPHITAPGMPRAQKRRKRTRKRTPAPVPGAWFAGARGRVRVLKAHVASGAGTPRYFLGADVDGGMQVATGDGVLTLETVQPAGSKPMAASAFLNGARLTPGAQMGPATPAGSGAEHGS